MIYTAIILLLLSLSFRYDINEKKQGRNFWYNVCLLIFILVAGLRYRLGTDTCNYIQVFYHNIPSLGNLRGEDLSINPLWVILNSVVYSLGGKFFVVQLCQSFVVCVLTFHYVKRHSRYIFTCALLFFLYSYFSQTMEEMKAGIAVALSLYGNDYMLNKKYVRGG